MNDLKRYGSGEGVGFYWVREEQQWGPPFLRLYAVDELGHTTRTEATRKDEDAALTLDEAVREHISPGVKQADAHLDRRRKKLADNPPEPQPEPMDPATAKFHYDPY